MEEKNNDPTCVLTCIFYRFNAYRIDQNKQVKIPCKSSLVYYDKAFSYVLQHA